MADEGSKNGDWTNRHIWQIQPVRDGLMLLGVLWLVYLGYLLSVVTVPLLLAITLAYLFEPLVRKLTKSGHVSRGGVAIGIILMAAVCVIGPVFIGGGFAAVQGGKYVAKLTRSVDTLVKSVRKPEDETLKNALPGGTWLKVREYLVEEEAAWKAWHGRDGTPSPDGASPPPSTPSDPNATPLNQTPTAADPQVTTHAEDRPDALDTNDDSLAALSGDKPELHPPGPEYELIRSGITWLGDNAGRIGQQALQRSSNVFGTVVGAAGTLGQILFGGFLTAFFFFFFCTGYGKLLAFWDGLIPEKKKGRVFELAGRMDRVIAGFVRGRLTICAILICVYSLGYWIIGVPAPLILGPIVGICCLMPFVSGGIGIPTAAILMALEPATGFQGTWWWIVGSPILIFMIAQGLDDYVLSPVIQGKNTDMDMPSILFAVIAGGALAGIYGLLIAIPTAACIKILLREVFWPKFRSWAHGQAKDFLPIEPD
ncbi:MAG: AI-2E family transporter [Phycisphaerales bacterium]|nr:AI-2E family transporter [Phycisphaerales bacterium]